MFIELTITWDPSGSSGLATNTVLPVVLCISVCFYLSQLVDLHGFVKG